MTHPRRSRTDITLDVLDYIGRWNDLKGTPCRRTRLMYGTNLSWMTLNEILKDLQQRRLIEIKSLKKKKTAYIEIKLTPQGQDIVRKHRAVKEALESLG